MNYSNWEGIVTMSELKEAVTRSELSLSRSELVFYYELIECLGVNWELLGLNQE